MLLCVHYEKVLAPLRGFCPFFEALREREPRRRQNSPSMASDTLPTGARDKVGLKKGFHLTDWVRLMNSATDIGGVARFGGHREYTMEEVAKHKTEHDCWSVFMGKVYNLTPYLQYHPGGADILIKTAGRDGTALFNRYHPWVNLEGIAGKLVIGTLAEGRGGAKADSKSPAAKKDRPLPMEPPPPKVKLALGDIASLMGKEEEDADEGTDRASAADAKSESKGDSGEGDDAVASALSSLSTADGGQQK